MIVLSAASAHELPLPDTERAENGQFLKGRRSSPATEFKPGEHWRPERPYWNADWLRWEYLLKGRSSSEIAADYGITSAAIIYWLRKHDIPRRSTSETRRLKHWGASGKANSMYGMRGDKHPGWKGGCTPERQACYSSEEWHRASLIVRRRDKEICQRCGTTTALHIHHIVSFAVKELRTEPSNLILLCQKCHAWVHGPENTEREYIIDWKGGEQE